VYFVPNNHNQTTVANLASSYISQLDRGNYWLRVDEVGEAEVAQLGPGFAAMFRARTGRPVRVECDYKPERAEDTYFDPDSGKTIYGVYVQCDLSEAELFKAEIRARLEAAPATFVEASAARAYSNQADAFLSANHSVTLSRDSFDAVAIRQAPPPLLSSSSSSPNLPPSYTSDVAAFAQDLVLASSAHAERRILFSAPSNVALSPCPSTPFVASSPFKPAVPHWITASPPASIVVARLKLPLPVSWHAADLALRHLAASPAPPASAAAAKRAVAAATVLSAKLRKAVGASASRAERASRAQRRSESRERGERNEEPERARSSCVTMSFSRAAHCRPSFVLAERKEAA
jgi:hypothetical protein